MTMILVTYATMAGSTAEVAEAVATELRAHGLHVDLAQLDAVAGLGAYDAVVLGAPMILGWHRGALRFLRRNRRVLAEKPLALFVTAMSLTETGERSVDGLPVTVDEALPKAPKEEVRLSFRERYARLGNYLRPILKAARPASLAVFGGRLEYGRLPWWAVLFAMFIIQAPAGDRRNWEAIRAWAAVLPAAMALEMEAAPG
jgi:menaquinone-dependent protoporphyrinogen oxidase